MLHSIRLLAVAFVSAICFVTAWAISTLLDRVTPPLDTTKSKARIFGEVTFQFGLVGIITYMSRGLIKKIPFPLEGAAGYIHSQLSDLRTLPLFVFIFMFFQNKTQDKMRFIK
jgi:hypothetical protein